MNPPLLDRLRSREWRLTAQRRVIAEVFAGSHVHLGADEVLDRAQRLLPEISRATVYNTLNELVELGELRELAGRDGRRLYDPNVVEEHDHLVCVRCGTLFDIRLASRPELPESERHGFEILEMNVTARGVCPRCAFR